MLNYKSRIAAAVAMAISAATIAQEADTGATLEEVVVTAQKRSERLQDVPLSVTALSADALSDVGVRNMQDMGLVIPSLSVSSAVGFTITYLRGVGSTAIGPGIEVPVSIYVDGVYYASTMSSMFDFGNIERVEVLKGPQGTLFGRNATGGLINVVTKTPTQKFQTSGEVSYDNFQTAKGKLVVSGGITDTLAADFAVNAGTQGEGWGKNLTSGKDVFRDDHDVTVRSKWAWEPGSGTRVLFIGDYTDLANSMNGQRLVPGTVPNPAYGARVQPAYDSWDIVADTEPRYTNRNWGLSLRAEHEFSAVDFMSLSAYRDSRSTLKWDVDFTEVPWLIGDLTDLESQFSQEFQLSSREGGPLSWTAGVYYFRAVGEYAPSGVKGRVFGGAFDYLAPYGKQITEAYAGFAQGSYSLTEATRLTLGARYTNEDRSLTGRTEAILPGGTSQVLLGTTPKKTLNFDKPTFRIALDHRLNPDVLTYVSFNTGFKSGGFNTQFVSDPSFLPETVKAYETGIKSDLLDRRVRLNAAAFYYDYKNIQVQKVGTTNTGIINGASAEIKGVDADFAAAVSSNFRINGSVAFLDAKFKEFTNAPFGVPRGGVPTVPGDASGNDIPKSPGFQSTLTGDYKIPTGDGSAVHLIGTWVHSGSYAMEADNVFKQKAVSRLNAAVSWVAPNDRWFVKLWGNNLTNEAVVAYSSTLGDGTRDVTYEAPRTYGLSAGYHFE